MMTTSDTQRKRIPLSCIVDRTPATERPLTIAAIAAVVCDLLGYGVDDLRGKSREAGVARARRLAWYVTLELTQSTYQEVGEFYGRGHSGVLHGIGRVCVALERDEWTRAAVAAVVRAARGV